MTRLFDVFGDFTAAWPRFRVNDVPGFDIPTQADVQAWLGALNNQVTLEDVRFGAGADSVAMEARLLVAQVPNMPRFVVKTMPDVVFTLLGTTITPADAPRLFVSRGDGVEVGVDGLPVEIALPVGMVMPPATDDGSPAADITVGTFTAGQLDSRSITYRESQPTTIRTHVRVTVDADLDVVVLTTMPISFRRCRFLGIPCVTVHDFVLIPEPAKARRYLPWLRHDVTRWFEGVSGEVVGAFAVRSVRIDATGRPLRDAANWLNSRTTTDPAAEYVLEDLVLPFYSEMYLPVPRHITLGIQRRVVDPNDLDQLLRFDRAPVNVQLFHSPNWRLLVNQLFFKSVDLSEVDSGSTPVTFDAAVYAGGNEPGRNAFGITLEDEWTVLATYYRDVGTSGAGTSILNWELAGIDLSVAALRVGVSIARLAEGKPFLESAVFAADIAVRGDPASDAAVRLEGMDQAPVNFVIEKFPWWFELSAGGLSLPDGVAVVFDIRGWKVRLIITEFGLIGDTNGAHYLLWSGGVDVDPPGGWDVQLTFRRLRKKVGGNPDAPEMAVEGFFLLVRGPGFHVEAGGYYRQERIGPDEISELGLGGTVGIGNGPRWSVSLDVVIGSVRGSRNFRYFLAMAAVEFNIPCGPFELTSLRALYANGMQPALSEGDTSFGGLRYYQWYRRTDPTTVSADRRLAAWRPREDAWAVGVGAGASFPAFGKVFDARVFILGVKDPDGTAFMLAGEVRLLQNPDPIGYLVVEIDGQSNRLSVLIGVEITPDRFMRNAPAALDNLFRLTGTLLIRTNPTVVAIGRLADQATWLRWRFEIDLWLARSSMELAFAWEISDEPGEASGCAFSLRVQGASWFGPGRVEFHAGLGVFVAVFRTGSNAFSIAVWIEAGLRFALFGFLNFGIHARADLRQTGPNPTLTTIALEVGIETPWFLPDVTFRIAETWGALAPAAIDTVVCPITAASSLSEASQEAKELFLLPQELLGPPDGTTPVQSIEFVRNVVDPGRDVRVSQWHNALTAAGDAAPAPLATDAAVQLAFSVAVRDLAGIGSPPAVAPPEQDAGDLHLVYEIVGFAVRRRRRFDPAAPWVDLLTREELRPEPDGSGGAVLSGSFDPMPLTGFWEPVLSQGQQAAMRLLLNSTTPFTFLTSDPDTDEQLLEGNSHWPCCPPTRDKEPGVVVLEFAPYPLGDPLPPQVLFPAHASSLRPVRRADVTRSSFAGTTVVNDLHVMRQNGRAGHLFRVVLDEPAVWVGVRFGFPAQESGTTLVLVGFAGGEEVVRSETPLAGVRHPSEVRLAADEPVTEVRAWVSGPGMVDPSGQTDDGVVEVDRLRYRPWAVVRDEAVQERLCDGVHDGGLEGKGKVSFLPNHEYELELRARVRVSHPSAPEEVAEYTQYAYFRTKGLPGLNAVPRVGAEVEPYVERAYPGPGGVVYRNEPVSIAFNEKFNVVVPMASRPAGPASPERDVLMALTLAVRPDVAVDQGTVGTATGEDWVVANRRAPIVFPPGRWAFEVSAGTILGRIARSHDPRRERLAGLALRPSAPCPLPDPRLAPSGVVVHPPVGGGVDGSGEPLWPKRTPYTAAVVLKGAPFVHRERFEGPDLTAFDLGSAAGEWSVDEDGVVRRDGQGPSYAVFGDADWEHLVIEAQVSLGTDPAGAATAVGIGVAFPAAGAAPGSSILALVERRAGGLHLALHRTGGSTPSPVTAAVPASAADAPVPLGVTVFDDTVRAEVGDVRVEVPRDRRRQGRLALVADGAAGFHSLDVASLPLYRTTFTTSRFESFEEQIQSFGGHLDRVTPDDLGSGAATGTVAGLHTATAADLIRVMAPGAVSADRHALFERWATELALPVRASVEGLELSRYERAGAIEALLLESPEPLRFSSEVTVAVNRLERHRVRMPWHPFLTELEAMVVEGTSASVDLPADLAGRNLGIVMVQEHAGGREFRLLRGGPPVPIRSGRAVRLLVEEAEIVRTAKRAKEGWAQVTAELEDVPVGTTALIDLVKGGLIGVAFPVVTVAVPVPVLVLTDGPERRALLIPMPGGAPSRFAGGRHRLDFTISRRRWDEAVPTNAAAVYEASSRLEFPL